MAVVTKTGARAPLADSRIVGLSWGNSGVDDGGEYRFLVEAREPLNSERNRSRNITVSLKVKECIAFFDWFAGHETFNPVLSYAMDRRSLPEKLRDLADKLEAEHKVDYHG